MVRRLRIGLLYFNNSDWIGGTYYVSNLISALGKISTLPKPELLIFTDTRDNFQEIRDFGYPHTRCILIGEPDTENGYPNWLKRFLGQDKYCDFIYPNGESPWLDPEARKVGWIPDFQPYRMPENYKNDSLTEAKSRISKICESDQPLILSSKSAAKDLNEFFPDFKGKLSVIRFAVTHPRIDENWTKVKEKYQLPEKFIFVPNQFWQHKNHFLVLEALKLLKEAGHKDVKIIFTGKENDHRNPTFFDSLLRFIKDSDLQENVKSLGFIDRMDQLQILKNSHFIIQPSKFEGWSTSIEDSKALSKLVLASDIEVHREQLGEKGQFFGTADALALSHAIIKNWTASPQKIEFKYSGQVERFGREFYSFLKSL